MAEYVEFVRLRIRNQQLDDVIVDVTEEVSTSTKTVNTMNGKRRAKGFKQGNRGFKLSLTAEEIIDPNLPDWQDLAESGERFDIVKQPSGGAPSISYSPCIVDTVSTKNSDGDGTVNVSIIVLDRKKNS